jgi:hypothetical protein
MMQDFNRRLESFKTDKWPSSITQTPKQIAEAGFYFTGKYIKKKLRISDSMNYV